MDIARSLPDFVQRPYHIEILNLVFIRFAKMVAIPFRWFSISCMLLYYCACTYGTQESSAQESPRKDKTLAASPIVRLGKIESKKITESSGLCLSSTTPSCFWTLNDSGNAPELYLLSFEGKLLSTATLAGTRNVDWEAMAAATIAGQRYLIIGDVGDNNRRRASLDLYFVKEPERKSINGQSKSTRLRFKFEGGPANCEAMSYDPASGRLWLIEKRYVDDKRKGLPGVFELDISNLNDDSVRTAQRIGDFPIRNVTGMAFSHDGQRLIIRNYLNAHLYLRLPGKSWIESFKGQRPNAVVLPIQRQGEAVCFGPDGRSVILTSEQSKQSIWQVNLPDNVSPIIKKKSRR